MHSRVCLCVCVCVPCAWCPQCTYIRTHAVWPLSVCVCVLYTDHRCFMFLLSADVINANANAIWIYRVYIPPLQSSTPFEQDRTGCVSRKWQQRIEKRDEKKLMRCWNIECDGSLRMSLMQPRRVYTYLRIDEKKRENYLKMYRWCCSRNECTAENKMYKLKMGNWASVCVYKINYCV